MNQKPLIRPATAADLQPLIQLIRACAAHMEARGISQWNEYYPSLSVLQEDLERGELYVCSQGNILLGCIVISTLKDPFYEPVTWLGPEGEHLYIHRLAVHPNFQKQGHARAMMDFAEDHGRQHGMHSVRLDTFSQNPGNMKFYAQRGYTQLEPIYFPRQSEHPFYCYELLLT